MCRSVPARLLNITIMWVPVSLTGKISCRVRNLNLNLTYMKNHLMSWPDDESNYYEVDAMHLIVILIIKKKKNYNNHKPKFFVWSSYMRKIRE